MKANIVSFIISVLAGLCTSQILKISSIYNLKLLYFRIFRRNTDIRFSIAYLFRIKIDDKYLLIKGNRIDQFQPIGGAYKFFNSAKTILKGLNIRDDDKIAIDDTSRDDLRVRVKAKHILKFIKWFQKRENREVSTLREFYEELIVPNYLDQQSLASFNPEYIKQTPIKITYSDFFKCHEILLHDIFEISLNDNEKQKIKAVLDRDGGDLGLFDTKEIEEMNFLSNGCSRQIGKHTQNIL